MKHKLAKSNNYLQYIILSVLLILANKVLEQSIVFTPFEALIKSKNIIIGLFSDTFFYILLLLFSYPLFRLIKTKSSFFAHLTLSVILFLSGLISLISIFHFKEVGIPFDVFVYHYSLSELSDTALSFENSTLYLLISILIFTCFFWLSKISAKQFISFNYIKKYQIISTIVLLLVIGGVFQLRLSQYEDYEILFLRRSKNGYFIRKSLQLASNTLFSTRGLNEDSIEKYQLLNPTFDYISKAYPFLHTNKSKDVLTSFFDLKETPPDIYIIITEGLGDNFLSHFKGNVTLMPFLDSLKNKSLYFNNFFTTGEGSFAAIPSILGSLPHGNKGFTLNVELPYHQTLLSWLSSKDYFTSFFYNHEVSFHKKGNFLKYNKINKIFDKECFSMEYEKILVGTPPYFFGYNDKVLLKSTISALKTFPSNQPYLCTIYTGSMHSPFVISETEKYQQKVENILKGWEESSYIEKYMKYLKTIPFTDDALRDFITQLKNSSRYIITQSFLLPEIIL
jgi:hypothetical protein